MTLTTPKIKSLTVKLKTDRPVKKTPYQVKGVLMRDFPNDEIVPMLNGSYRKKFLYPRIQVKIIDEEILLVGLHQGVDPILAIHEKIKDLKKLPKLVEETLLTDNKIQNISNTFNEAKGSMFLGRGLSYPIALEGALKLKELSYIHAEGYPAGEMKHGPLALIEEGMPVVVLAPRDNYYKKTISNMQEVIARGAKVLLITNKSKNEVVSENIWETIEVQDTNDDLLPFLLTIPLQKLAYYSALKKGCLLYTSPSPRDRQKSRMPSSA